LKEIPLEIVVEKTRENTLRLYSIVMWAPTWSIASPSMTVTLFPMSGTSRFYLLFWWLFLLDFSRLECLFAVAMQDALTAAWIGRCFLIPLFFSRIFYWVGLLKVLNAVIWRLLVSPILNCLYLSNTCNRSSNKTRDIFK
jgi:hypothetical protein